MSTRSTTHFIYGNEDKPNAIIYRHPDGYPEGAGHDLLDFIDEVAKLSDTRFSDSSYLAARYVVFLSGMFAHNKAKPLDFISVGVLMQDPGDIDYRYVVDCKNHVDGKPKVTCYEVSNDYKTNKWTKKLVEIPAREIATK